MHVDTVGLKKITLIDEREHCEQTYQAQLGVPLQLDESGQSHVTI